MGFCLSHQACGQRSYPDRWSKMNSCNIVGNKDGVHSVELYSVYVSEVPAFWPMCARVLYISFIFLSCTYYSDSCHVPRSLILLVNTISDQNFSSESTSMTVEGSYRISIRFTHLITRLPGIIIRSGNPLVCVKGAPFSS